MHLQSSFAHNQKGSCQLHLVVRYKFEYESKSFCSRWPAAVQVCGRDTRVKRNTQVDKDTCMCKALSLVDLSRLLGAASNSLQSKVNACRGRHFTHKKSSVKLL